MWPRGLFVLISDITEIKLAEQKIIANEGPKKQEAFLFTTRESGVIIAS